MRSIDSNLPPLSETRGRDKAEKIEGAVVHPTKFILKSLKSRK